MGQINPTLPVAGSTLNNIADPEVATALQQIVTLVNGNIDLTNLSAAAVQALQASTAPLSSHSTIATSESRTNTAYGTLTTPDQIIGLVVPANGLVAVQYQAMWSESVSGAASAAIFIGSNQLVVQGHDGVARGPLAQAALLGGTAGVTAPLFTFYAGLAGGHAAGSYAPDATTGQALGYFSTIDTMSFSVGASGAISTGTMRAGPCYIYKLPAGTYTVSVQFKASSGNVTASNRLLLAAVLPFG